MLVSGNYIAMTFDDGPHPQNTPRLLDMLRARNIKATFFVIGRSVDLYPQVVRRTVAEGHEIGNHSHTHRLLSKLSDSEVTPRFVPLPRCRGARRQRATRASCAHPTAACSSANAKWSTPSSATPPSCGRSIRSIGNAPAPAWSPRASCSGTTAGAIILAHDLHAQTVDAMPATLDGLLGRGFQFVTVSQLLAMKTDAATAQAAVTTDNT